jgi:acetyl esterase
MSRTLSNRTSAFLLDGFFASLSAVGRSVPMANPKRHGVERLTNLSYGPHGKASMLDIWRPIDREENLPVVFYVHGGGFRALSKDSHWIMGLIMARQGYLVVSINYRLAPKHPYPVPLQDTCSAWLWALENVAEYGGDPKRIAIGGESAGANLAMALTVAACYPRPEPWAKAIFDAGVVPKVAMPACGIFQVSDVKRYARAGLTTRFAQAVIDDCEDCYLPDEAQRANPGLADPLCIIENETPVRALPPTFLPVGGGDPLKQDNHRMAEALANRGTEAIERVYPGEMHAFHALIYRRQARQCWKEMLAFLDERV